MYTHISKCKNDKIKERKKERKKMWGLVNSEDSTLDKG
jgi:hypothetical protein